MLLEGIIIIYKVIWTPFIGEQLLLEAENGNLEDRHAVAYSSHKQLHVSNSAPPTVPRLKYMGVYSRWAFIDKDRAFTMDV